MNRIAKKTGRYRSKFESNVAKLFRKERIKFEYEVDTIPYKVEEVRNYIPDFRIANGWIVEAKGRFTAQDRKKHLLLKKQYPDMKLIILFMNSRVRLSKTSKTTYADWCTKNDIKYADWRLGVPKEIQNNAN